MDDLKMISDLRDLLLILEESIKNKDDKTAKIARTSIKSIAAQTIPNPSQEANAILIVASHPDKARQYKIANDLLTASGWRVAHCSNWGAWPGQPDVQPCMLYIKGEAGVYVHSEFIRLATNTELKFL
ncbi:hypothetical protein GCM10027051_31370 [Niabella terrae]